MNDCSKIDNNDNASSKKIVESKLELLQLVLLDWNKQWK